MKSFIYTILLLFIFQIGHAVSPNQLQETQKLNKLFEQQKSQIFPVQSHQSAFLKSVSAKKDKLDSITHNDGSYKQFKYNENNQITSYKFYEYDDWAETVELVEFQSFKYDKSGNEIYYSISIDDAFDGFVERNRIERTYDSNNRILTEIDIDLEYNEFTKMEYDYSDGLKINMYSKFAVNEDWTLNNYSIYTMNKDDLPTQVKSYDKGDDGIYFNNAIMNMAYNSNGQLTEMSMLYYNEDTGEWVAGMSTTTEYNAAGQVISERTDAPNYATGKMALWSEIKYTYENGHLVKEEEYGLNWSTGEVQLVFIREFTYKGQILVSQLGKETDWVSDQMTESYRYEFTINTKYDADDQTVPYKIEETQGYYDIFEEDYYQTGRIESVEHFRKDWATNELYSQRIATFYYSGGSGSEELSNDATLSDLTVGGNTIDDFDKDVYAYTIVLDAGTASAPEVHAIANHASAMVHIKQADELPGTATIQVTAEDATTQLNYTINFTLENAPSNIATLSDLQIDGSTIDGFQPSDYVYAIILSVGTTEIPTISGALTDPKATMEINQATELPGTGTVLVTAEDGTQNTYTITFSVQLNNDATLAGLQVNGSSIADFNATTLSYDIVLDAGTTEAPTVSANATDANASVEITQANDANGSATIEVTAEDGTTTKTYTINFTVQTSIFRNKVESIKAYPNPFNNQISVHVDQAVQSVSLLNNLGQSLYRTSELNKETVTIETSELKCGIYFIQIIYDNQDVQHCKVIKQ